MMIMKTKFKRNLFVYCLVEKFVLLFFFVSKKESQRQYHWSMFLFLLFPKNTSKTMANKQKWDEKKRKWTSRNNESKDRCQNQILKIIRKTWLYQIDFE